MHAAIERPSAVFAGLVLLCAPVADAALPPYLTGVVEDAESQVIEMPRLPGLWQRQIAWLAPEGSTVAQGDVVVRLDPGDLIAPHRSGADRPGGATHPDGTPAQRDAAGHTRRRDGGSRGRERRSAGPHRRRDPRPRDPAAGPRAGPTRSRNRRACPRAGTLDTRGQAGPAGQVRPGHPHGRHPSRIGA